MKNLIYEKISDNRAREFQLKTSIVEEDGKRYVYKEALHEEGIPHVKAMLSHYDLFREQYAGTKFEVGSVEEIEYGVRYEYIEGRSLSDILDSHLENRDIQAFFRVIKEYKSEIDKLTHKNIGNLDLVFSNIIVTGNVWQVIDTEWTIEEDISTDYLLYRAIKYYMIESKFGQGLVPYRLYERFGIDKEACAIYQKKDDEFQSYVRGIVLVNQKFADIKRKGIKEFGKAFLRRMGYGKGIIYWNLEYPCVEVDSNFGLIIVQGWALCYKDPIQRIEITINDESIDIVPQEERADVEKLFRGYGSWSKKAGFYYEYVPRCSCAEYNVSVCVFTRSGNYSRRNVIVQN